MMQGGSRNKVLGTLLVSVAALLVFASYAVALTAEQETYKTAVEPICKSNKAAADRLLGPVKGLVKNDKLRQAGTAFSKAAVELEKTEKKLAAVAQPASDAAKLTKWLSEIKAEVALMKTISSNFKKNTKAGKSKATSLAVKLQKNATKANNLVISYQFNYCKIDPSKYT
jgi:hypothetical protein